MSESTTPSASSSITTRTFVPSTAPSTSSNTNSGRGRGNASNNGTSNRPRRSNRSQKNEKQQSKNHRRSHVPKSNFKGNTEGMNGHVFERYDESGDRTQFTKTVAMLKEYAAKNLKCPEDLRSMFDDTMIEPEIAEPEDLPDPASTKQVYIWQSAMKTYNMRSDELRSNLNSLYSVIWGQCSENVKTKLKSLEDYTKETQQDNCVWLLQEIKGVMHQFDTKQNGFFSALDARTSLLTYKQEHDQSNADYFEQFKAYVDVLEYYGATVSESTSLLTEPEFKTASTITKINAARDRTLAALFLKNSDTERYGSLLADLANQYSRNNNQYPTDLTSAYGILVHYQPPITKPPAATSITVDASNIPSVTNTTNSTNTANTSSSSNNPSSTTVSTPYQTASRSDLSTVIPSRPGFSLLQTALSLTQLGTDPSYDIPPEWVLLDTQSTFSVFNNDNLVSNIRSSDSVLHAVSNGGYQVSHLIADVHNLGTVWYNPHSIANVLSFAQVRRVCRVTMDTHISSTITVHKLDGSTMLFVEQPDGLYAFNTNISPSNQGARINPPNPSTTRSSNNFSLLQTVAENKAMFTSREIEAADQARRLYRILGCPSQKKFEDTLSKNFVINCPLTVDDAKRATLIYGDEVSALKGKTTRSKPAPRVPDFTSIPLPAPILEHHKNTTLCVDFFYIQGQCFLHTISRKLQYRTMSLVNNRNIQTMRIHLQRIIQQYHSRGFLVNTILADAEFECLRKELLPIHLDTVSPEEHVGEIERSIRTIKERVRTTVHSLPFTKLPRLMIKEMAQYATQCLNQLPADNGLSDTMSPHTIMTGQPNPNYNNLRLEFGAYVQVYEPGEIAINNMRSRTTGAIALTTTENYHGHMNFMSLASGKKIVRGKWAELPIPEEAILRVEQLATTDGQPLIQNSRMIVEWRPDTPFEDDDDADYVFPGTEDDEDLIYEDDVSEVSTNELTDIIEEISEETVFEDVSEEEPLLDSDDSIEDDMTSEYVETEDAEESPSNIVTPTEQQNHDDITVSQPDHQYNLRPSRERSYMHRFDHQPDTPDNKSNRDTSVGLLQQHEVSRIVTGLVMTQMSAAAGIKKFGQPAWEALLKEFQQLHDKKVFTPRKIMDLSQDERKGALRAVNLIKEKSNGQLKGRTCADGSKQRNMYEKHETSSPTLSNDALMCTLIVDSKERRDVATADVVGAYLNADMKDFVLLKLTGEAVDVMTSIDSIYLSFVGMENNKRVLYLQLDKALYGCVQSALLWYELFTGTLMELGFELNPYDACVANKIIDGKQCTIVWYVDDTKISHINPDVVTDMIEHIESKFGKMTVTRGNTHTFLGMEIKLNDNETVTIGMTNHIVDAIEKSGLEINKTVTSPAQKVLFEIDNNSDTLSSKEAEEFHSTVAKLLYVSLRARPDILLATSFLCTRVSQPTIQDQKKLKRVLEYLQGTLSLTLTLGADHLSNIRTWVDASYATHEDMKSHTGGLISFGTGGIFCKSSKQKINTKSSTEAELVGASDYLVNTIWLKMFLEAQGISIESNILEQDNRSAILLEKNGKRSAGKQSRHINIRYFYIQDRLEQDGIIVRHCDTENMVADFFTKPLQGALFTKFRNAILGYTHMNTLVPVPSPQSEERVGNVVQTVLEGTGPGSTLVVDKSSEQACREVSTNDTDPGWIVVKNPKRKLRLTGVTKKVSSAKRTSSVDRKDLITSLRKVSHRNSNNSN